MLNHLLTILVVIVITALYVSAAMAPTIVVAIILALVGFSVAAERYNAIFTIIETWRGKA